MSEKETLTVEFFASPDRDKPFGARILIYGDNESVREINVHGASYLVYGDGYTYKRPLNFQRDIYAKSERELKREVRRRIRARKRVVRSERIKARRERIQQERKNKARQKAEAGLLKFEEQTYEVEL